MARELTLLGFFTSRVGITENMEYVAVPDGVSRLRAAVADEEARLLGIALQPKEPLMTVDRRIIDLYNEYVHTALPRREFLTRLAQIAGGSRGGDRRPAVHRA